jgi:hypothetical protein
MMNRYESQDEMVCDGQTMRPTTHHTRMTATKLLQIVFIMMPSFFRIGKDRPMAK